MEDSNKPIDDATRKYIRSQPAKVLGTLRYDPAAIRWMAMNDLFTKAGAQKLAVECANRGMTEVAAVLTEAAAGGKAGKLEL